MVRDFYTAKDVMEEGVSIVNCQSRLPVSLVDVLL